MCRNRWNINEFWLETVPNVCRGKGSRVRGSLEGYSYLRAFALAVPSEVLSHGCPSHHSGLNPKVTRLRTFPWHPYLMLSLIPTL